MKVFAALVLLITVFGSINSKPRDDQDLAKKLKGLINEFFENLPNKAEIKNIDVKFPSNFLIYGDFDLIELSASGYKNISIDDLTFDQSTSRLKFTFSFADILLTLQTRLSLDGVVDIDNSFSLKTDLKNLKIEGNAVVAGDRTSVDDLSVSITLKKADFDIKGFLNSNPISQLLSLILSNKFAELINEASSTLSPVVSGIIKTIINFVLKDL